MPVRSPSDLGGSKSEEYLKLNPYGKIPLLTLPDGSSLYESEVRKGIKLVEKEGKHILMGLGSQFKDAGIVLHGT